MTDPNLPTSGSLVTKPIAAEAEYVGGGSSAVIREALQQERKRVAQILHDTACQDFAGMHLLTRALALEYQTSCPEVTEKLQLLTEKIQLAGSKLMALVHALSTEG